VIATEVQYGVSQLIEKTTVALGIQIRWERTGVDGVGYWNDQSIIKIDPKYFCPTEVEILLGDPSKAIWKLRWSPELTLNQMIEEMAFTDLAETKKHALLKKHGFSLNSLSE
jgi:GDPmannose 4,6-dehydratase